MPNESIHSGKSVMRQHGCVALLQTGKTYGRDIERFDKHVTRLVRYYFKPGSSLS